MIRIKDFMSIFQETEDDTTNIEIMEKNEYGNSLFYGSVDDWYGEDSPYENHLIKKIFASHVEWGRGYISLMIEQEKTCTCGLE